MISIKYYIYKIINFILIKSKIKKNPKKNTYIY
jgi:hypothetical protein